MLQCFGWFGFNAGSALAADGLAASAFVITHIATAMAVLAWALLDVIFHKKSTMLGAASGAVAGLVAITPAAGFVNIYGALFIGFFSSVICYFFVVVVKAKFKYDDALDAFGIHGIGGIFGALATGLFATPLVQSAYKGFFYGNPDQLRVQFIAVGVTIIYSFIGSIIIYKIIDMIIGVRVSEEEEMIGLNLTEHNERAYTILE